MKDIREQLKVLSNDVRANPEVFKRRAVELDEVERKFQAHPPQEVSNRFGNLGPVYGSWNLCSA